MNDKAKKEAEQKEEYLKALGLFTMSWSSLVHGIEALIWEFLDLDPKRGTIVTCHLGGQALLSMLKSLVNLGESTPKVRKDIDLFMAKLDKFNLDRVDFMHSYWKFSHKKDGVLVLKSERFTSGGKLKPKMKSWTHDELLWLVKGVTEAAAAVTQSIEEVRAFKARIKTQNSDK